MLERGPVVLDEDVGPLHDIVGTDPQYLRIERPMMDGAHGDAIGDNRLTSVCVLLEMRGVEKLRVS
jgi:hypothetical protein